MIHFSTIANVAPSYVHRDKQIMPSAPLTLNGGQLKWYDIAYPETPVPDAIRQLGRAYLEREAAAGRIDVSADLGFVVLHRCGHNDFYFLILNTWRNENELWESVYAHDTRTQSDFELFPRPGPHRGTYCVWEMGAVWHEQQVWRRYLRTARDDAAKRAWFADSYSGPI
ncbi:MAG: hypothetical protein JO055_02020 [Alphaproteobacteria bacterium]|nr:hypothetical protein [Alphaproteobacteria bacterium]